MTNQQSGVFAKDFRLDILRTIACVMVVFIHVANYYCRAFSEISSVSYLASVIFNTVCRVSVPIFFMLSGMLLLRRPVDLKKNTKRILEKLVYLVFITGIYLLWDIFYMGKTNINYLGLISNPERKLLWFMYAIIGLYVALPFIRRMVENMTKQEDVLFIVLWVALCGGVHLLNFFFRLNVVYPVAIINGAYYLGYFVMGHIIGKYKEDIEARLSKVKVKMLMWLLCLASFTATVLFTYLTSLSSERYYKYFFQYKSLFIIIASVLFFLLIYTSCKNKENKLVSLISKHSFEIYLFHGIVLDFVMLNFDFKSVNGFIGILFFALVIFTVTLLGVCGFKGIVSLIKKSNS